MTNRAIRIALLMTSALVIGPALAADVTPERLANPDKEPQNWLMNHRSYDAQRFSPLARISKDNVKNLKLAYAVAIGGTSANENLQATPLVEDGFMYVVDIWGIVYKIDVRSGTTGRIVWRMDPKQERVPTAGSPIAASRCGAISSSRPRTFRRASSRPTRTPARSSGRPTSPTGRMTCSSPPHRSPSRTRSSSAPPAATAACATGSPRSMPRPASSCGETT